MSESEQSGATRAAGQALAAWLYGQTREPADETVFERIDETLADLVTHYGPPRRALRHAHFQLAVWPGQVAIDVGDPCLVHRVAGGWCDDMICPT